MIFNEKFYKSNQPFDPIFHVRLAGELFPDKNYCIERSGSKTGTIIFITAGTLKLEYNNKSFSLKCGDSVIFPPQKEYVFKSDPDNPACTLWVNVRGTLFENTYHTLFPKEDFPICTCNIEREIRQIFDIMQKEADFTALSALTLEIMLKMYSAPSSRHENACNDQTLAGQFEYYISQCIQEGFSIADMCEHFNISKDKLVREFKQSLHTTPYQYYQDMRLSVAKSLLLNSNLTIEDIAYRLKFNDRNSFTTFFIKNAGISPAKYRTMHHD